MAKKSPLEVRKSLEDKKGGKEFTIEETIPLNEHISIYVRIDDKVAEDSTNTRDALLSSRDIKEPDSINGLSPEVKTIIERIRANEERMNSSFDALPAWMKSGTESIVYNALQDAIGRVKRHHEAQFKLAFTQALLVAFLKNAVILVDGEKTSERFYAHKNVAGVTYVEINPMLECNPIPNDYFDDSEKNKELVQLNRPILPKRNVREVCEQQVAWLDMFQETHPVVAMRLNSIFNDALDKLAHVIYGGEVGKQVDEDGFQPSNVDSDLEKTITADSQAGE